eukprot:scaffold69108_cov51-Phaeocystis_antarctica.AAC.2
MRIIHPPMSGRDQPHGCCLPSAASWLWSRGLTGWALPGRLRKWYLCFRAVAPQPHKVMARGRQAQMGAGRGRRPALPRCCERLTHLLDGALCLVMAVGLFVWSWPSVTTWN